MGRTDVGPVDDSIVAFESRDDAKAADQTVADLLKEMFRHKLPKVETFDSEEDDFVGGDKDDKDAKMLAGADVPGEDGRQRKSSSKAREGQSEDEGLYGIGDRDAGADGEKMD